MTALRRPSQIRPGAGQHGLSDATRHANDASLLDNLAAQLDGSSGASAAAGLVAPMPRQFRDPGRSAECLALPPKISLKREH